MKALDKKLLRDLIQMRGQVLTIALVVASAVAGFVGTISTYVSLDLARQNFYERARFADVFSVLKRAPNDFASRIADIPDVADAQTTVVFDSTLDIPGVAEPLVARMVGVSATSERSLNRIYLRRGRMIDPTHPHEAIVSEAFAVSRGLAPGSEVSVLLSGHRETLKVVGIGLSPDYVYATQGGAFPDDRNFGVFWMDREYLASAYDMEGAFNDVAIRLAPHANARAVIDALDRELAPYGGSGAYGRDEQISNRILDQEIGQWKVIAAILPSIFLAVATFLLNVVLSRQIAAQREQIAALKALGYGNSTIAGHYLKQVLIIVALGAVIGVALGYWMCHSLTALYAEYFRFPEHRARLEAWVVLLSVGTAFTVAVGAALAAVRRAVRLPPAEAMRPPSPASYRPLLMERLGMRNLLSPATNMVLRQLERRPLRALATVSGIAAALSIIVVGLFWRDALDYMISVQFDKAQRADVEIALVEPAAARMHHEIARLPGVARVEVARTAAVRLVFGHRSYRTVLQGIPERGELRRLLDADLRIVPMPPQGVLLTERLARRLGVHVGENVTVELLEGDRTSREVPVVGTVQDLIGLSGYMDVGALNRLMHEDDSSNLASVTLDSADTAAFFSAIKGLPRIATAASKRAMLDNFRSTMARNVLVFTGILTAFAVIIAIGVVYNNARIALAERAWELASLRVLGFTRVEVSALLLSELAIETALAIPLGCALGYWLSWIVVQFTHSDLIEIPVIVSARTYAYASVAIVLAGIASALIVRRRVDGLDLVGVLKTRE